MDLLEQYDDFLVDEYQNFPQSNYVNILLLRKTESETIFRTENEGGLTKEFIRIGDSEETTQRVVMTKRKQVAVERRTGRELLRKHDQLFEGDKGICALNRNTPCGECIDCMLYGFAAGGGGAQKARVITNDAYSLLAAKKITDKRTFNALYDDGTMRDPETGEASASLGEVEYIKPETHFIDVQTLKDVTKEEFIYVLGNILRSFRYGAISSKIGKMKNYLLGIYFSDCELASNLELTQEMSQEIDSTEFPLATAEIKELAKEKMKELTSDVFGRVQMMSDDELTELLAETQNIYQSSEQVKDLLETATEKY
ncbi:type I-D CRISPR-associated protein Cas7/Csc2 [Halanaerobacter jeridensis]|uniref:CRISPR-associated protein Csc2 n=1 Tax=Halanaerobacter jeridensis TaxID=706427 RepID=A0A938XNF0_9FIRM|nr:type I-D CRISPR-associated protein Cas7/Csc2 [Halanaerobacter jeridensis]MBM7555643.1 CRISPR-associated protein Csc2 [Halanaerobacter jeridensis]